MSLTKRTTRRLSLMAGSSLVAAGLTAIVSAGAALAPTAAAAQATCTSGTAITGNGTNNVVIAGGNPNNPGITCLYVGDNALVSTAAATTVSTVAPGGGVNLTAAGTDDINWNSTAGTVTGGAQTNGPVIDARTAAGDINLTTGGVTGSNATITHGIYALSTGGGDISITSTGTISGSNATSGIAAIEARSTGGNGDVIINAGSANGRLYGVLAQASGSGDLRIALTGGASASLTTATAIIDATTGSGLFRFDAGSSALGNANNDTSVVRATLGGDALLNLNVVRGLGADTWLIDLDMVDGATATINANGQFNFVTGNSVERKGIRVQGGADVDLNIGSILRGVHDFSDAGATDISIGEAGLWEVHGITLLSGKDDSLTIAPGGRFMPSSVHAGSSNFDIQEPETTVLDFGAGEDRLINQGEIVLGHWVQGNNLFFNRSDRFEIELRLENLEFFDNSGLIVLGRLTEAANDGGAVRSDGYADDILYMSGTTFTGSGDSTIAFDVNVNGSQSSCDAALRDPVTHSLPAADCVRIENGATAGLTKVVVRETVTGDRGSVGDIVLIDVSGGTSDGSHFVLDPASSSYNPSHGGFIDKGFFAFPLVYDAETQQHKLVGTPGQNAQQFPLVAQAAHGLWRLSTGSWLDRQADLRGGIGEGVGGGVWMRIATEFADRDAIQTVDVAGNPFAYDNTHEQSSYAVTGGLDVMTGDVGGAAYVLGLTAGYIHADMAFDASPNAHRLDGWSGGGYASLISGGLFVDAAVNANRLELEADVPGLNLIPTGTMLATNLTSVGAQVEAGWRLPFANGVFVEPLAGVSYVRSKWDDLNIAADDPLRPGVIVEFDDPTSLRAGAGARVGLDQNYGGWRAQYSLLGRVWNEFGDETRLIAHNTGADALIMDEFTGTFSEFGVGVSVYGLNDALSGFFNFGGKFGDDYSAQNLSAGVRVNW